MPKADACLLDTNILLRMSKGDDPHYRVIGRALRALVTVACVSVTPPRRLASSGMPRQGRSRGNGFGLSVSETDRLARVIERDFEFLPDSQAVHDRWRRLLVEYVVPQLLTINVRDFARFVDLRILHAADVSY
jgi:hypothetical protein